MVIPQYGLPSQQEIAFGVCFPTVVPGNMHASLPPKHEGKAVVTVIQAGAK